VEIREFQALAKQFSEDKGFDKESLDRRIAFLITEIGEVVKEAIIVSSQSTSDEKKEAARQNLGLEIYDAIWNLTDIANRCGIDLEESFKQKMLINDSRTWN
jgi:NTP pyrophosphatase (non-canonical NTP hydrolase)